MALRTGACYVGSAITPVESFKLVIYNVRKEPKSVGTYKADSSAIVPVLSDTPKQCSVGLRKLTKRAGTIPAKIAASPSGTIVYTYTGPKQYWA